MNMSLPGVNSINLLNNLLDIYNNQLKLKPCCSIEFEFYVKDIDNKEFLDDIANFAHNRGIKIHDIAIEASNNQFEIAMKHSFDIPQLVKHYLMLKTIMMDLAKTYKLELNFTGKPFGDDFHGNGMHIHISLYNNDLNNVYCKEEGRESKLLLYSVAGLLEYINAGLIFMNEEESDFSRYKPNINIDTSKKRYVCSSSYAPTHICWGKNNRTVAIRIPDSVYDPDNRHIEYRVAVPNADPNMVLFTLLLQIKIGIEQALVPSEPIHGNAFDKQYNLEKIISNASDALACYEESDLKGYIESYTNSHLKSGS